MGADAALDVIAAEGRMRLRRVAAALDAGRVVFAAIDNNVLEEGYSIHVTTAAGTWYFSDQVPRLASARRVPLWACVVSWELERVRVVLTPVPTETPVASLARHLMTDSVTR